MNRKEYLELEIKKHNQLYWVDGNPEISDPDYDKLIEELKILDPNNSLLTKVHTPTISETGKVKHKFPMLSMDKVYSHQDLLKWCRKVARDENEKFLMELKYDGCSAELNNGILSTRGDGIYGENITNKIPITKIVKGEKTENISNFTDEYTKGEIIITKLDFQENPTKLVREDGTPYKTERNAVAGLLNKDEVDLSLGTILTFIDFDEFFISLSLKQLELSPWDMIIESYRNSSPYPGDGIVIKIADKEYAKSLGATDSHLKSEMALKFPNPTGISVLKEVIWSSGKHKLTPIGKVNPVNIGGVTVTNINLHNFKYILDKNIFLGDKLIIERAGDVIPDVQKVIPGINREIVYIETCPVCHSRVEYKEPEMVCLNPDCFGKLRAKILDSVVRIGIEGLGEPTIQKMIDTLNVENLVDILTLQKDKIIQLEGFAEPSSNILFNNIQIVKRDGVYDWQILAALNLPGIGKTLSKELLLNRTLEELKMLSMFELESIENVGPERAKVLSDGLCSNDRYLYDLLKLLPLKKKVAGGQLSGKKFALTGAMPLKRNEIVKLIEEKGGTVAGISKEIDFLVQADPNSISDKSKNALKWGVKIISFEELERVLA